MFNKKQATLISRPVESSKDGDKFLKAATMVQSETKSGNGALKYSTTGNCFVDDFAAAAYYKEPRSFDEVSKTMEELWALSPIRALKMAVYMRMVTRETDNNVSQGEPFGGVQRGQGLKNEGIMRMMWIAINHKAAFTANLPYYLDAGCWNDVFEMMSLDLQYNGWDNKKLDWNFLRKVIYAGLTNERSSELVKKYLPKIRNNKSCVTLESQARTLIGRYLASGLFGNETEKNDNYSMVICNRYRKLKRDGTAHIWQQLISKGKMLEIDFNTIPGRALSLLVSSKFLKNQGLVEKYTEWISKQRVAKNTSYVHELFAPLYQGIIGARYGYRPLADAIPEYLKATINAQFYGAVELAQKDMTNNSSRLLVVRDTSSSMTSTAVGTKMSSYGVGKALAIYFSHLLNGPFKYIFAEFADTCKVHKFTGATPVDMWMNDKCEAYGSTNLESVADMFVRLRTDKNYNLSENEFPNGALLVSDGEFNRVVNYGNKTTNFQAFRNRLLKGGFSKEFVENFKLILWDIPNGYYGGKNKPTFESDDTCPNTFYMSGYDPSIISFLFGTEYHKEVPKTPVELYNAAMDQDLLNRLFIPKAISSVAKKRPVGQKPTNVKSRKSNK